MATDYDWVEKPPFAFPPNIGHERGGCAIPIEELAAFRVARAEGNCSSAWCALERGHILSQRRLSLHLHSHGVMLRYALARDEWGEAVGQMIRLVLAPLGTITGRIPRGNTGRSNVSAFEPMAVPHDIAIILDAEGN